MTGQLLQFHQQGGLWYGFLGVHVVGMVSETGKWMSGLEGDLAWRRGAGDADGGKAALISHVRQWYDAAHQPLQPGQAERLCKVPRASAAKVKQVVSINPIDVEAVVLRLKQAGVVTTYTMPPVAFDIDGQPQATLAQALMYCISAAETSANKLRAAPADQLAAHETAVFAGLVRLIDACSASAVIKRELQRIARERVAAEAAAKPDLSAEALAKADQTEEGTRVDEQHCPGHVASDNDPKICRHCGIHIDRLRPPEDEGLAKVGAA